MSGKSKIRKVVDNAPPAPPSGPTGPGGTPPHGGAPAAYAGRFKMRSEGLFRTSADDNKAAMWVCGPFEVQAETWSDEARQWGLLVSWRDRSGQPVSEVFPRSLFAGECGELRGRLADGGLTLNGTTPARQALAEFLNVASTPARARCVSRTGWHRIDDARAFILPDATYGRTAERIVLQATSREPSPFNQAGTLDDWRRQVAEPCIGNSRLVFAVACAFAGPLLEPAGEDGGGFHYRGPSRAGKTTALRVSASVWGGAPGAGAGDFIRTWRATGNGLEGIAATHSDALLPLDEMGQIEARELGQIAYMLGNGQGKARSDRGGGTRAPVRFRVLFLSTGEIGLADKSLEAGQRTQAGQEVRLVDVPADTGRHGIFEELHDAENAGVFADLLRDATRRFYGTAARAFLEFVTDRLGRDPEFPAKLRARIDARVRTWLLPYREPNGQVRSVARRFALVAEAGELATEALVTGWAKEEAAGAAHALFLAWLEERGTTGAREDAQAIAQLRGFISRHGGRFERWDDRKPFDGDPGGDDAPPANRFNVQHAVGWKRWDKAPDGRGAWTYFVTADGMGEALAGLDKKAAVRVLAEAGHLVRDGEGKSMVSARPPGVPKRMRLYQVIGTVLGAGLEPEATPEAEAARDPSH